METPSSSPASAQIWRSSVNQSFRNNQVREISRVLASLEPGATAASKLRLAMQFEDAVYKKASSLDDYRKTISKRLAKLQKNYVPPVVKPEQAETKDGILKDLRQTYGDAVRYILEHADTAVEEMRKRHGDEKAVQLKQHTNGVKVWAADLGLLEGTPANVNISQEQLEKLKGHLERRLENIRSHVVKLADPDQFMAETLAKREQDFFLLDPSSKNRPSRILAECIRRRYEFLHMQIYKEKPREAEKLLAESLELAQKPVPLPTKNNSQENDEQAALIHLDKMRAASSVWLAYLCLPDKTTIVKNSVITKAHNIAIEGIDFCKKVMKTHREKSQQPSVVLEDAWTKQLILPRDTDASAANTEGPLRKKPRLNNGRPVMRSRLLLAPNRKTPSNLLQALQRKRARLVRPPPNGEGSHIILEFGDAFVMTIYFCPLIVSIRAAAKGKGVNAPPEQLSRCVSWTPLHHGLVDREELTLWGAKGNYKAIGSAIEERLRDASVQATAVLRQCFAAAAYAVADFEIEILEATALLEFVQLARTTYIPDWQDDDG